MTILLGWVVGILINHLANTLPLRETPWQVPFCKRRLDGTGSEFISTAHKDDEAVPEQQIAYCHAPRPLPAWSGLIAYLTGRQRCANCGKSMGLRPLFVELAMPGLFFFLAQRYPASVYLVFLMLYTSILVLLLVTDLEHRLIQNVVILPAILLASVGAFYTPTFNWKQALIGGAIGFVVFYILAILARGGLGSGDVTLSAFLGLITALPNVMLTILLGIFLGGVISGLLIVTRRVTLKTFIPYGPFLIIAGWIVLIWGDFLFAKFWG
jgi:prepilin signal peptidase PulO-like enzyme (type II secretory pathway)